MSLGRLLAAGKSLVGGQDNAGRYRVNKRVALPKFISPRNPFAPSAKTGGPATVVATAKANTGAIGKENLAVMAGARVVRWVGEWSRKMNPLLRSRSAIPEKQPGLARSALPRINESPIQSELSLDNVRVMRNDLSDADFEVVTKPTSVVRPVETVGIPQCGTAGSAWDRMTSRLAGRTV
jgi:hypothetical protein